MVRAATQAPEDLQRRQVKSRRGTGGGTGSGTRSGTMSSSGTGSGTRTGSACSVGHWLNSQRRQRFAHQAEGDPQHRLNPLRTRQRGTCNAGHWLNPQRRQQGDARNSG